MQLSPYGVHRVLEPKGVLPQAALRLDAAMPPQANEVAIAVKRLNIDSASMAQLRKAAGEAVRPGQHLTAALAAQIQTIVSERGKMHNPVTNSGGMLIGDVTFVGTDWQPPPGCEPLRPGDRIATLVSLTLTPLRLEAIEHIDADTGQVAVQGQAILFSSGIYAKLPDDIPANIALAVLDVCGAPAQTARLVKPGDRVVVLGGGGKSGILCCAAAKQAGAGQVIAIERDEREQQRAARFADAALRVDATDAVAVAEAVAAQTGGAMADLVISCVNAPHAEMGAILAARQGGTVYFFSMATSFQAAALGAEGVGRDVNMLIGNGYAPGHAQLALDLVREHAGVRHAYEEWYA